MKLRRHYQKPRIRYLARPPENSGGFTLADVAIASAIFAGVLIVCLGAFIAMGEIYFRGSLETRVQEVSRSVVDEIARTLSTTAVEFEHITETDTTLNPKGWEAYCIAGVMYSFLKNKQLDRNLPSPTFKVDRALVKSIVLRTDSMGNTNPTGSCNTANTPIPVAGEGIELLDYRMRIQEFDIKSYGRLHVIKLNLFYGGNPDIPARENEVFEFPLERYPDPLIPFDKGNPAHLEFTDDTRCEVTETFCFISRARREVYQSVSE